MKLDLRLIVPGRAGGTILLAANGTLPATTVEGDEDEAAVVAVTAYLRDVLGLRAPVLETHPRWPAVEKGEPIPTLVLTETAPQGWTPPSGLRLAFGPNPAALDGVPAPIVPRAEELLDELRTGAPPPPLRPRWARSGWQARACGWMIAAAADAGRPLVSEPTPFFLRGILALLRAETANGALFLKAVFPPFHAEPEVTRLLAERAPASVPRVRAIEVDEAVEATRRAVERVAGLGFPTTVVHGDFHAGNAALVGDQVVIIDWSDAAIGNPLIDLVTWLSWSEGEPDQQRVATDAWIEAWAASTDPAAVRAAIADILIAGAAYQVVSYEGIVRALEPATRYTMGGGASHFLERLQAALEPTATPATPAAR